MSRQTFRVPLTLAVLEEVAEDASTFRVKSAPRLDVNDGASLQRLLEGSVLARPSASHPTCSGLSVLLALR